MAHHLEQTPEVNMNRFSTPPGQANRGIALIVALVLLVLLTILGVASMNSVVMQERMAGNVNLQSLAFEAASAGVSRVLHLADSDDWPADCRRGDSDSRWFSPASWDDAEFVEMMSGDTGDLPDGVQVGYRQMLGCFEPEVDPPEWADFDEVPMQLLVLNRGEVRRGNEVLARREVEVRISRSGGTGDCLFTVGPLGPDPFGSGKGAASDAFRVDADEDSCPIRFANPADAEAFREMLGAETNSDRTGNWQPNPPGIISSPPDEPWRTPLRLARAMNAIKIGLRAAGGAAGEGYSILNYTHDPLDYPSFIPPVSNPFQSCSGTLVNSTSTPPSGGLTYVAGDLNLSGNHTVTGTVIVEGEFTTSGTVRYLADLVILGGQFDGNGLGGAESRGLIYVYNLQDSYWDGASGGGGKGKGGGGTNGDRWLQPAWCTWDSDWDQPVGDWPACSGTPEYDDFGAPENPGDIGDFPRIEPNELFSIAGGGNATITSEDCENITNRWEQMNSCLATLEGMARNENFVGSGMSEFEFRRQYNAGLSGMSPGLDLPDFSDEPDSVRLRLPACDGDTIGGQRNIIASWREYIDRERWPEL